VELRFRTRELVCAVRWVDRRLADIVDQVGARSVRAIVTASIPMTIAAGAARSTSRTPPSRRSRPASDAQPVRGRAARTAYIAGKHLSVLFVATADYVLTTCSSRRWRWPAGEDGSGAPPDSRRFRRRAVAGRPAGRRLGGCSQIEAPDPARSGSRRSDLRASARIDGGSVIIEAAGNRR
jgi:hypothetical protein